MHREVSQRAVDALLRCGNGHAILADNTIGRIVGNEAVPCFKRGVRGVEGCRCGIAQGRGSENGICAARVYLHLVARHPLQRGAIEHRLGVVDI